MILEELFGESLEQTLETKIQLRFGGNGRFRVLMISDIHGGVGYNKKKTVAAIDALVESTRPQLVMLGGDNAGPGVIHIETEDQLRSLLTDISGPMESRGVPWAHVFGNHDDNYGVPNRAAERIYEEFPHCVSKAGPECHGGTGNYLLPVYPNSGGEPIFGVWGMDSHGGMTEFAQRHGLDEPPKMLHPFAGGHGSYDSVDFGQVMWYYLVSMGFEKRFGRRLPSMMIMHIPLPEYEIIVTNKDETHFFGYDDE
ncbi:MAG: metallophosphoesterase, partial [Clostridiales bacterium]|nr:metallophosphoesterase [Clostridiales bacterium]